MTDEELMQGFEDGSLAPAAFGHREHVRLTWLYLARLGRDGAERRLLAGLRAFAIRAGRPEKFSAALTLAWIDLIATAARDGAASFEELIGRRPDLLDAAATRAGR